MIRHNDVEVHDVPSGLRALTHARSLTRPRAHAPTHAPTSSLDRSLARSPTQSPTQSRTHTPSLSFLSLAHSLTHSLAHSLTHSLTHSPSGNWAASTPRPGRCSSARPCRTAPRTCLASAGSAQAAAASAAPVQGPEWACPARYGRRREAGRRWVARTRSNACRCRSRSTPGTTWACRSRWSGSFRSQNRRCHAGRPRRSSPGCAGRCPPAR